MFVYVNRRNVRERLLRIVREAVRNAGLHSGSDKISIKMENSNGISLIVRDKGRGFDSSSRLPGSGLETMQAEAARIGASYQVTSRPGEGTTVEVRIPP